MSAKVTDLPAIGAPEPTDQMYIVRPAAGPGGSFGITNDALFGAITRNIADRTLRFEASSAPPVSLPGMGAITFLAPGLAPGAFAISENGGPYRFLFSGVPRLFPPIITTVPTIGSDITGLQSFVLPPDNLKTDGDLLGFDLSGQIANNNNPKRVWLEIGGLSMLARFPDFPINGTPDVFNTPVGWRISGKAVRTGASSYVAMATLTFGYSAFDSTGANLGTGSIVAAGNGTRDFSPGNWTNTGLGVTVRGQGVDDGDIVQNLSVIELVNF